ncbi:hypothetical protein RIF29_28233 [Crotalaria pallida]|uniref:Peptide deformylase n=1 Tax=Crotalaria pallida TaxID=3830 RepID=A0AAN9I1S8_CROPI
MQALMHRRLWLFRRLRAAAPLSLFFFQNNNNTIHHLLLPSSSSSSSSLWNTRSCSTTMEIGGGRIRRRRREEGSWFSPKLPNIVKAGDPVLHNPANEVELDDIKSETVQNIIDDMITVMRKAPGVGLAAPQIGIPLKIIVLEDTKEYISYDTEEEVNAQDRKPFDLLVILNPKLKKKSNRTALFFEGCLSVDGFLAVVERHLDVEVEGFDRYGEPIKINASGWQARILQHECDHLDGTLYVDKMIPRTFRSSKNMDLPLAHVCPKLGPR